MKKIFNFILFVVLALVIGVLLFLFSKYSSIKEFEIKVLSGLNDYGRKSYILLYDDNYSNEKVQFFLGMTNFKKNYEVELAFECKYLINMDGGVKSLCYDNGEYAQYTEIVTDEYYESKKKVANFSRIDFDGQERWVEVRTIKLSSNFVKYLSEILP